MGKCRITEAQVRHILAAAQSGSTYVQISQDTGISRSTIRTVVIGSAWSFIAPDVPRLVEGEWKLLPPTERSHGQVLPIDTRERLVEDLLIKCLHPLDVARQYGIGETHCRDIKYGRALKHVLPSLPRHEARRRTCLDCVHHRQPTGEDNANHCGLEFPEATKISAGAKCSAFSEASLLV